eukprot:gene7552-8389_t
MAKVTLFSLRTVILQDTLRRSRNVVNVGSTSGFAACIYSRCMSEFSVTRSMLGVSKSEAERDEAILEPPPLRIHHCKREVRCMPKKMNMVAKQVRKLPVDEAISQMKFSTKKAAETVKQVLEEAKQLAMNKYGVEDGTNLFVGKYSTFLSGESGLAF